MMVKRRKLVALENAFAAVGHLSGVKFVYGIGKNSKRIADDLELLREGLRRPTKEYRECERKRADLCKEYATKDESGKPITMPTPGGQRGQEEYIGLVGNMEFDAAIDELEKEYKNEIDKRDALPDEYDDALDEEIEFEYYMISMDDVPEQITVSQLRSIMDVIKDDEPTKTVKKEPAPKEG